MAKVTINNPQQMNLPSLKTTPPPHWQATKEPVAGTNREVPNTDFSVLDTPAQEKDE